MADHPIPEAAEFPFRREVHGPAGTARLGREVSGLLSGGEIILLHGKLGAGKTCFTQGLCGGLALAQEVVSPTFTLVNSYEGRLLVHHLDFYRLEPGVDMADIGLPDILDQVWDGKAVAVVEWPDPLLSELDENTVYLELLATQGVGQDDRIWHLRGFPEVPAPWADLFAGRADPPSPKE